MLKKGPERKDVIDIIIALKKKKKPLFEEIAKILSSARRSRPVVNVSKIARFTHAKSVVVIPGKVLGSGALEHAIDVVALDFSASAREKIEGVGGKCRDFKWLIEKGAREAILLK
ncbi:MAG: 50S ribosomal protein L18e [Candidatus Micrarchaeia archaeon]